MNKKFLINFQKGFVAIPLLAFILVIVTTGGVGFFKLIQIENKVKNTSAQIETELGLLHKVSLEDRALKEKVKNYEKLGVKDEEVSTHSANLAQLILKKDFFQAFSQLIRLDKRLEEALTSKKEAERAATIEARDNLEEKIVDYKKRGVNVTEVDSKMPQVRNLIDSHEFSAARDEIERLTQKLEQLLKLKLEAERKVDEARKVAIASVRQSLLGATYERKTVQTLRGNFSVDVLTVNSAQIQVVTDTANDTDCENFCPTKPLAQFVADRAGIAGINGTYFCPPDYSTCSGKVASFDFPVYNTILGKFINSKTLFWGGRAMVAFDTAGKPYFFREANSFGGVNLKAAIVNYPALISGGQIVVDEPSLSSNLGQVKGNRGALGFRQNTVYAVIGRNATVGDMAYIMQALGAENAMNLDGGGSSALYFSGSYKVGPGRSLPNAVVFVP